MNKYKLPENVTPVYQYVREATPKLSESVIEMRNSLDEGDICIFEDFEPRPHLKKSFHIGRVIEKPSGYYIRFVVLLSVFDGQQAEGILDFGEEVMVTSLFDDTFDWNTRIRKV